MFEENPSQSTGNLPTVSAEELHKILVKTHRIAHCARYKFLRAILALEESRLYLELGCSSTFQYARKHFGYSETQTHDLLRVARALAGLPLLTEAYREGAYQEGAVSWSAVQEITRVASAETEGEWIEFARKRGFKALKAEVRDAREKNRKRPRSNRSGLAALVIRLFFELNPEEAEIARQAFQKLAAEMSLALGGKPVEPKEVLLYLLKRVLETDWTGTPPDRVEREASLYSILYHVCTRCRASKLMTPEGPVEVPPESVERVEGEARKVEITPEEEEPSAGLAPPAAAEPAGAPAGAPAAASTAEAAGAPAAAPPGPAEAAGVEAGATAGASAFDGAPAGAAATLPAAGGDTPAGDALASAASTPAAATAPPTPPVMVRKVHLRDGQRCANPHCGRKLGLHAHHIIFRSNGGPTNLYNLLCVCNLCHTIVHSGRLDVRRDAEGAAVWTARSDRITVEGSEELKDKHWPVLRHRGAAGSRSRVRRS